MLSQGPPQLKAHFAMRLLHCTIGFASNTREAPESDELLRLNRRRPAVFLRWIRIADGHRFRNTGAMS